MPIKLTAAQYKIIGLAVAVAAVSLAISFKYFGRAFPEASLDLHLDRNGSTALAEAFLTGRGFKVAGYRHAAIFSYNDDAKVYLERTQGLARMDALTRGPIHLWRWSHRWFRPQQKEEFRVDVSTAGAVVGFSHEIPEAAPGANLEQPAARAIAEQYLGQVMKFDLGGLEFVEGEANKRPARTDYTFTWKQTGVNLGDGSHRIEVDVAGDQVSASRQYVKIPEQWSRDYEKLRSRNDSAQIVDEVFWVLLSVVMLAMLVMRLRDRDLRVRLALGFGLGGTVLLPESGEHVFARTVRLLHHRLLLELRRGIPGRQPARRARRRHSVLPSGTRFRARLPRKLSTPAVGAQPVHPARTSLAVVPDRQYRRTGAHLLLLCLSNGVLSCCEQAGSVGARGAAVFERPQHAPALDGRGLYRIHCGRFRGDAVPRLRHSFFEKDHSLLAAGFSARGVQLGIPAFGISESAVLHPRRRSWPGRDHHGRDHAALRNRCHADLALLGGRAVQRVSAAALAQPLPDDLGRDHRRNHAGAARWRARRLLADGNLYRRGAALERQRGCTPRPTCRAGRRARGSDRLSAALLAPSGAVGHRGGGLRRAGVGTGLSLRRGTQGPRGSRRSPACRRRLSRGEARVAGQLPPGRLARPER